MRIMYFVALIFSLVLVSCHKDKDFSSEETGSIFTAEVVQEINGSIMGYVYDEQKNPVANAIVRIYSGSTTTNSAGLFHFNNAKVDKNGTYIKVIKDGYMLGSDYVFPDKGTAYSHIQMIKIDGNQSFESKDGGTINMTGGGKVIFPADAIIGPGGELYEGKVQVTAKFLSPKNPNLGDLMPGGLLADAANGNTVVLGTAGMIAVELKSPDGQELNLGAGKKARIQVPIVDDAFPTEIPLWSFDENKGRWQEDGKAVNEGSFYVGEVSHFSFWNCDVPFPLINVCGTVLLQNGQPAINYRIQVQAEGLGTNFGYTDQEGRFCGKMPKGKTLTISILSKYCDNVIFSTTVGPFNNNVELDAINLSIGNNVFYSGTITCNGAPVTNGVVVITQNGSSNFYEANDLGVFEINYGPNICSNTATVTLIGVDLGSGLGSPSITLPGSSEDNIVLNTCILNCDFTASFELECGDNGSTPGLDSLRKIRVIPAGGSGNYSYQWERNGVLLNLTGNEIGAPSNGLFCVTVRDEETECEKKFCKELGFPFSAGIEYDRCGNKLFAFPTGQNYSYQWSSGETASVIDVNPGQSGLFTVTITDLNGCSSSASRQVEYQAFDVEITPANPACNQGIYTFNVSGTPNYTIVRNSGGQSITLNNPTELSFNVFETEFNISLIVRKEQCGEDVQIELPRFAGLDQPTIRNTSCGTCEDGQITPTINPGANCRDCVLGSVIILSASNITQDFTDENNAGQLPAGTYYVVVTDANTGCYISFRRATVQ